jgi:hypothetical protein
VRDVGGGPDLHDGVLPLVRTALPAAGHLLPDVRRGAGVLPAAGGRLLSGAGPRLLPGPGAVRTANSVRTTSAVCASATGLAAVVQQSAELQLPVNDRGAARLAL